jgi:hypothetical protein
MKLITILFLCCLLGLGSLLPASVSAQVPEIFNGFGLAGAAFNSGVLELPYSGMMLVKGSQSYDETKDPALRKGTENWEQEQGSFFTIPALVLGVVGIILFFNRK